MRIVHIAAAAALTLTAATGLKVVYGETPGQARAASIAEGDRRASNTYRLAVNGQGGDCLLWPGEQIAESMRSIGLSKGCSGIKGALEKAHIWVELPHGDVVIADAAGTTLVEFGVSDGAAFESFRPFEPMMTLTALR